MLSFTENEREALKVDLERMIGFFDKLKELDTEGVAPLLHMSDNQDVLRSDEPGVTLTRAEALKNAPLHNETAFLVPKAIRKTE